MKKFFTLLLILCLLLVAGCSTQSQPTTTKQAAETLPEGFLVGYCSIVINPTESLPLEGYTNEETRYFKNISDNITASVIAISDESGNDILIVNTDFMLIRASVGTAMQQAISEKTGVIPERIYISANHSHSAPYISSTNPKVVAYREKTIADIADAAAAAMADRQTATMYTGSVETESLNFVKHYSYVDETGTTQYFGDNFGTAVYNDTTDHVSQADPTMHLVRFERQGGKDVILANWRAHPHFTSGASKYELSSDYIGPFREVLGRQTDAHIVYLQGACGNINSSSRLNIEEQADDHRAFGALLADYAAEGLKNNMSQVQTGQIKTSQVLFYGQIDRSANNIYLQAQQAWTIWKQTNSWEDCDPYMTPFGIRSPYHALAITQKHDYSDEDGKMILNAVSIGDKFAFVTFPGELFDTLSAEMEAASPFATTMLIGYSNGHVGYLASAYAHEYTCYETDVSRFMPGTGEQVQQEYIRMLEKLTEG